MMITKQELLEEINKIKDKCVIVEGKRDIIALKKLGFSNIFELKNSIFAVCEEVAKNNSEVVILMDLDNEGKLLYHKLKENFDRLGVKINDSFREVLFRTKLSHIEGLDSYLENLS